MLQTNFKFYNRITTRPQASHPNQAILKYYITSITAEGMMRAQKRKEPDDDTKYKLNINA